MAVHHRLGSYTPPYRPGLQATFDDSLHDEAVAKKHCTIGEAVEAGAQAGAYLTMLTHFSQRYPKLPVVDHSGAHQVGAGAGGRRILLAHERGKGVLPAAGPSRSVAVELCSPAGLQFGRSMRVWLEQAQAPIWLS